MKKTLIAFAVVLLAVPAFAQTPTAAGNFVVSLPLFEYTAGSGDLYENADGDGETTLFIGVGDFQSGVEWFVIDSLAIGGMLGYRSFEKGDYSETTTIVAPMVTYYLNMGQIIPYAGVGYSFLSYEEDDGTTTTESETTSLFFKGGAAFMLGKNLAAFGEVIYSMNEVSNGVELDGTELAIALGIKAFF